MTTASFFVLTYNQEAFIRESFESVLAQDYKDLQIVISDDHSSDRTFDIIQEIYSAYRGPHQVTINRNAENIGLITHIREALKRCSGEIIVAGAGDDIYLPQRVSRIVEAYVSSGRKATSFHSSVILVNMNGDEIGNLSPRPLIKPYNLSRESRRMTCVIGATHAWSTKTFDVFGPINTEGCYEDLIISFRSMLIGEIAYIDEPLVKYRIGNGLVSSEQATPTSFSEYLVRHRKTVNASIAVMQQRIQDTKLLNKNSLLNEMIHELATLQAKREAIRLLDGQGPAMPMTIPQKIRSRVLLIPLAIKSMKFLARALANSFKRS